MGHLPAGLLVAIGVLVAATLAGLLVRARDGRVRAAAPNGPAAAHLAALGVPRRVTLLQFSSPACGPCRAVRRTCAGIVAELSDVAHVEVDAEHDLAAARAFDVWRTPTLLLLDPTGRVVHRTTGTPGRGDLLAALRPMLAEAAR
jgi:thiol-disulfide isomerase/thioredoxin